MLYRKICLLGFLFLTGCGFTPLYKGMDVTEKTSLIRVEPITDEIGQKMRWKLQDLLNPNKTEHPSEYTLRVTLDSSIEQEQGIRADNTATRAIMVMTASYVLVENKTQHELLKEKVSARAGYNILTRPYATYAARQEADEDTALLLAQDISLRIAAFFKGQTLETGTDK